MKSIKECEKILEIGELPFRALFPEKTVPILTQRGWKKDDLIDLHHDGFLNFKKNAREGIDEFSGPLGNIFSKADYHNEVIKYYSQAKTKSTGNDQTHYIAGLIGGTE